MCPSNPSVCWSRVGWLVLPWEATLGPWLHPRQVPHAQCFPEVHLFSHTFTPGDAIVGASFPGTAVRPVFRCDSATQRVPTLSPGLARPRAPRQSHSLIHPAPPIGAHLPSSAPPTRAAPYAFCLAPSGIHPLLLAANGERMTILALTGCVRERSPSHSLLAFAAARCSSAWPDPREC